MGRGRPKKSEAVENKDKFEEEKKELRIKTENRVAEMKKNSKVKYEFCALKQNGKVYKYQIMENGNKFSKLLGVLKDEPRLQKYIDKSLNIRQKYMSEKAD